MSKTSGWKLSNTCVADSLRHGGKWVEVRWSPRKLTEKEGRAGEGKGSIGVTASHVTDAFSTRPPPPVDCAFFVLYSLPSKRVSDHWFPDTFSCRSVQQLVIPTAPHARELSLPSINYNPPATRADRRVLDLFLTPIQCVVSWIGHLRPSSLSPHAGSRPIHSELSLP
jgi:hypothetical protein